MAVFSRLQLQLSVDEAHSRLFEAKQELTSLQRERDGAQASVEQLTQVRTPVEQTVLNINLNKL